MENAQSDFFDADHTANSGKATASLVLGILSLVCNIFTAIPSIILGSLALSEISRSGGRLVGKGKATTGILVCH